MPRIPRSILLAGLGAATACDVDEPTAPAREAPRPATEIVTAALATVGGRATVDDPGDVGLHTSLVSSSDGTQRITYYDQTSHRLKYASCSSNCTVAANWQRGVIDDGWVGEYSSLKVKSGVRHAVYYDRDGRSLKYARCSADCFLEESWKKTWIDQVHNTGLFPSLAIGGDGRLYVSYVTDDYGDTALRYATCLTSCTSAANWQKMTVDPSGVALGMPGPRTSIAIGADGRRHIAYSGPLGLKYATCAANCTNPANWEMLGIESNAWAGEFASLAVDASGVRHISYFNHSTYDLKYARCASNCGNSAGWSRVTVDQGSGTSAATGTYTSLAVGSDGKVHVSYYDQSAKKLKYATCAGNCLQAASWSRQYVDGGCPPVIGTCTNVGGYTSLKLGGGKVHISYYNFTSGNLKYAELTQ
jgi:hypothetical protein